jgi:hippurate hydrolase
MKNFPSRWIAVAAVAALPLAAADLRSRVSELASAEAGSLVQLYTHLHQHPELSFHEKETAVKLIAELKPLGFDVTPNVGGQGFVAVMKNGSGPTVLVRTDLDALPVVENTARPYASKVHTTDENGNDVGVMHACGHDIHMTSFIGTARVLSKLRDRWSGTLVMIGQPAEERGAGAKAMLDDGLYQRFPRPDYALGLHVDAALETGRVGYHIGYALANVDSVDITIRGVGGHGAYPHNTKDPVVIAAQVILALQTIVSREVRPIDSAVVTVGSIHGGAKHNVIPDEVKLQITVRSYTDEVRQQIHEAIRRITVGIARAAGVPADREPTVKVLEEEFTPALYNNAELAARLLPVWKQMFGDDKVVERDAEMGGEDFSRYGREEPRIPIFLFRTGTIDAARMNAAAKGGTPLPSLHSALFWPVPETTIETGVKAMSAAVLELMGKK